MRQLRLILLLATAFLTTVFSSDAAAQEKRNYVLAPLRTQLHRIEISSSASAILIVNANALEANELSDSARGPCAALEADLKTLSAKNNQLLRIVIQHAGGPPADRESDVRLKDQLKQVATRCSYLKTQIGVESTSQPWDEGTGSLGSGLLDDGGEEDVTINEILVSAPIRTRISKLRIGQGDAYVKLRRPIDARNLQLSDTTAQHIRSAVDKMKLTNKKRLHFYVYSTQAGASAIDRLFSSRQPPLIPQDADPVVKLELQRESDNFPISAGLKLAQELGFQEIGCSHSPCGGAPEKLLEGSAPDFELVGLDGKRLTLAQWRMDRPAMVTFWGLACGPCRLEAPHLSRLHEKYGSEIGILAINAYDETPEAIAEYAKAEQLKHTIAVQGGDVANSSYHVAAYPTTFWIDRQGKVVRYVIGFENGDELERELIGFLKQN